MTILEIKRPYEFLVRWDTTTGILKGSHVAFSDVLEKDGVFLSETVNTPIPVGSSGFPLSDVLSLIQSDSLIRIKELEAELDAKIAELSITKTELQQYKKDFVPVDTSIIKLSAPKFLQALTIAGVRKNVDEYVASSTNLYLKDLYYRSTEFWSNDTLLLATATELGLTESDVLAIFQTGQTL